MRKLLLALLLITPACLDERDEFYGSYRTAWTTTIVRESGTLSFASADTNVLVRDNGDDAVWISANTNQGANLDCGVSMIPADGVLVLEARNVAISECRICDQFLTNCWSVNLVAATATLAGEQLTFTSSGGAQNTSTIDAGTATVMISGLRKY